MPGQVPASRDPESGSGIASAGPHARVQADVRRISIGGRGKRIRLLLLQSARASEGAGGEPQRWPVREWEEGTGLQGGRLPLPSPPAHADRLPERPPVRASPGREGTVRGHPMPCSPK